MGLGNWLMVNWCFNTGKQMNIWRTPGCELPHDAERLLLPCVFPIYTLKCSSFVGKGLKEMPPHLFDSSFSTIKYKMCSGLHSADPYLPESIKGPARMIEIIAWGLVTCPKFLEPCLAPASTSSVNEGRALHTSASSQLQLKCKFYVNLLNSFCKV